jgi:transcriptional regulator with XRE-family HTH domain
VEIAEELERIRRALAEAAERSRRSLRALSQEMGQHPAYWTRALAGKRPLRLERALGLLAALTVDAEEFFEVLYPLGGPAEAKLVAPAPDPWERQGLPSLRETMRRARALSGEPEPTPASLTARAGQILRQMLRRAGLRQRRASEALGLGPGALGQALRGNAALNVEQVLATLQLLGVTPARFFAELFGPADAHVLAGMRWSRFLDRLEGLVAGAAEGLLAESPGQAPVPPARKRRRPARRKPKAAKPAADRPPPAPSRRGARKR